MKRYPSLIAAALLLARRGRALLFCVLAFPMSLSLGASLNEDGLLIATAVFGFALGAALAFWQRGESVHDHVDSLATRALGPVFLRQCSFARNGWGYA